MGEMRRGAVVLCGGRSTRMGRDKATLPFGDETLLQRVVRLVSPAVEDVVVVARPGQDLPPLGDHVRVARDDVLDHGPLGGLLPGLRESRADAVYATACDVPYLRRAVVDLLFDRLGAASVAVAEAQGYTHPLAAVYRTSVRAQIEALLAEERLRPVYLYDLVATVRVGEDELRHVDPTLGTLANLNTPEAYEAALAARPMVKVELYETARRRAGLSALEVEATTLGEALREVARRLPALVPDVVVDGRLAAHARASVNGTAFVEDPATPLSRGDSLLLISALSGG